MPPKVFAEVRFWRAAGHRLGGLAGVLRAHGPGCAWCLAVRPRRGRTGFPRVAAQPSSEAEVIARVLKRPLAGPMAA